ncbi:MAG: alpha/beta hydrolase [Alphaproteobacteria bacterium]|nr:alpha/beta hydrolase [Alphaproteobacteria bacterium]
MELHPQIRKAVGMMAGVSFPDLTPGEARATLRERVAILNQAPVPLRRVMDLYPTGPGGPVPLRVYVPVTVTAPADPPLPVVVYFHGGGWTIGCHDTVEPQCRYMANAARAIFVSVEYRLAPEHKFPAAVEDCQWAVRWVHEHAEEIGADPTRIAIAGDSAGGNLTAVTAQQLRDPGPQLCAQVLICPITKLIFDTPSYEENADGPVLTRRMQERWREYYLDDEALCHDARVSPLLANDFSGLPPAIVITASHDPLRDEGIAYAERLAEAGVPVRHRNWEGYTHLFPSMGGYVDAAFEALDFAAAGLRDAFNTAMPKRK